MVLKSNKFFSAIQSGDEIVIEEILKTDSTYLNLRYENDNIIYGLNKGSTPLIIAIQEGHVKTAKNFLIAGADLNLQDSNGTTALEKAVTKNYCYKHIDNYKDIIAMLLDKGANPNLKNKYGNTPLMLAALECFIDYDGSEIATMLLNKGADPNWKNNDDFTALIFAAQSSNENVAALLLNNGADPNLKNNDGFTALMYATGYNEPTIVDLLLNNGADPNIQNEYGFTALMYAAEEGFKEILSLLLNKGANPHLQSNDGDTAIKLAIESGHKELENILITAQVEI